MNIQNFIIVEGEIALDGKKNLEKTVYIIYFLSITNMINIINKYTNDYFVFKFSTI